MGRFFKNSSPVKTARSGWPATTPIIRRAPVPELPKSSAEAGSISPPSPAPVTIQLPSRFSTSAPSACRARAVHKMSSDSSSPEISVRPSASAPRIKARCEMDLSPGTWTVPCNAPALREVSGFGLDGSWDIGVPVAGLKEDWDTNSTAS